MGKPYPRPTPEQLEEAKKLRATVKGARGRAIGWDEIAKRIGGTTEHQLMKYLDPERYNRRNQVARRYEARRSKHRRQHRVDYLLGRGKPCEAQLAERERAFSFEPTPNHVILGDPPPGRSALERRG